MIPYLEIPTLRLFGLEFDAFGLLVAAGFWTGTKLAARRAERMGLEARVIYDAAFLCLVFGFTGAHLFEMVAYQPDLMLREPWRLLYIWSGISSFGGFIGATAALLVYFRRAKLSLLTYSNPILYGFLPGWVFGRLGCFTAHDHPGRKTDFFLGVQYPGGTRHDLGLYEALLTALLALLALWMIKKGWDRPAGRILAMACTAYGISRFLLDFLRAEDVSGADARYAGFTPAQYLSLILCGAGIALFLRRSPRGEG